MKKCTLCQKLFPLSNFNKKNTSKDGLQNVCRPCNRERSRKYYKENKDKHYLNTAQRNSNSVRRNRKYIISYLKGHPCVDCGESDPRVLDFDHVRGVKKSGVNNMARRGVAIKTLEEEIDKCDIRCKNCHTKATYNRFPSGTVWYDYIE